MITIYSNIAPYLSYPSTIKEFIEKNEKNSLKEIINIVEKEIQIATGLLKTDFQILLNEISKHI